MSKSLKELAQDALRVQDACNLSGVAHGFARTMSALNDIEGLGGTDARNNHPIARVWADKIAHLTGTQTFGDDGGTLTAAYKAVHDLAEG